MQHLPLTTTLSHNELSIPRSPLRRPPWLIPFINESSLCQIEQLRRGSINYSQSNHGRLISNPVLGTRALCGTRCPGPTPSDRGTWKCPGRTPAKQDARWFGGTHQQALSHSPQHASRAACDASRLCRFGVRDNSVGVLRCERRQATGSITTYCPVAVELYTECCARYYCIDWPRPAKVSRKKISVS